MTTRVAKTIIVLLIVIGLIGVSAVLLCNQSHQTSSPVLMKFEDVDASRQMVAFPRGASGLTGMDAEYVSVWAEGKPFRGLQVLFNRPVGGGIGVPKTCELTVKPDFFSPATVTKAEFQKSGLRSYTAMFPELSCQGALSCHFFFEGALYGKNDGSFHFDVSLIPLDTSIAPLKIERKFFLDGTIELPDLK